MSSGMTMFQNKITIGKQVALVGPHNFYII
jgi:hypothetical protein